jgi:NAD kinase
MQFPLVVPLSSSVRIVAADLPKRRMRIVLDGESVQAVRSVEVSDSQRKVRLLRPSTHLFVKTLSHKFIGE